MKTISLIFIIISFFSCEKRDKLNHYLNKPITKEILEKNGFYKYSYIDTIENENKIDDSIKSIIKYEMYSNVKPQKNENGEQFPTQLSHFYLEDSIKEKKHASYLKKDLNNIIITYLFRNNVLFYKHIKVFSQINMKNEIVDLTSQKKIVKYYNSLNIAIQPIIREGKNDDQYVTLFVIDNYKTRIYYSSKDKSYEFYVNYINDDDYDVLDDWYSGQMSNTHYYL